MAKDQNNIAKNQGIIAKDQGIIAKDQGIIAKDQSIKAKIFYHRAYRKIARPTFGQVLSLGIIMSIFTAIIIIFSSKVTYYISIICARVLSSVTTDASIELVTGKWIIGRIYCLSLAGKYPSAAFALGVMAVSILTILLAAWIKPAKPFFLWLAAISLINCLSSLFFFLVPYNFPHSLEIFSALYMRTEVFTWLSIPALLAMVLLPLPSSILSKTGLTIFALLYSLVAGTLRYILSLFLLSQLSMVFMPLLFFLLGTFFDAVYLVGIYSFYISRLSIRFEGDLGIWKWLY